MFEAPSVAVLVLTFFINGGMVTSRAINAPSLEDCKAAQPLIIEQMEKLPIEIDGKKFTIDYIDGQCIVATKGRKA